MTRIGLAYEARICTLTSSERAISPIAFFKEIKPHTTLIRVLFYTSSAVDIAQNWAVISSLYPRCKSQPESKCVDFFKSIASLVPPNLTASFGLWLLRTKEDKRLLSARDHGITERWH